MRIQSRDGHTLVEVVLATVLIGMVFLMATSIYVTSLKFLTAEKTSPDVNGLLALETMVRDISKAQDAVVGAAGQQLQLRIDPNDRDRNLDPATVNNVPPATADPADDLWVTYRFLNNQLLTRPAVTPAVNITDNNAPNTQVVTGLVVDTAAGRSGFALTNPTAVNAPIVVQIQVVVNGGAGNTPARILNTSAAVNRAK